MSTTLSSMDIERIMRLLPHRYPLLLVDRVISVDPGKQIHAIKNVSINEPHFTGHFPHFPVMPGVLILEALAQASALMTFADKTMQQNENDVYFFVSINDAKFKRPVVPGDQLHLHCSLDRFIRGIWRYKTQALVDGAVAAEAMLMCTVKRNEPIQS